MGDSPRSNTPEGLTIEAHENGGDGVNIRSHKPLALKRISAKGNGGHGAKISYGSIPAGWKTALAVTVLGGLMVAGLAKLLGW